MRLFFALWPPAETALALEAWARTAAEGKVTRTENIHLTLAFLGESDPQKAIRAAERVRARAFELRIERAQYWRENDIVWAGPEAIAPQWRDLVVQLHQGLHEEGFVLDQRPFAAHITLLRKARRPRTLPPLPPLDWPVSEFLLVRSQVSSKGSTYEPLRRFMMQA
ncbi:MAG: 2'-5' RNA ligase [Betaproteobacteria bacterium 13_1_20CM_3_63_8]|nr:MAG: 2'-5' RNA ligase [Betaproteobacteria bacterium 13_1_20CM_3_63_8]